MKPTFIKTMFALLRALIYLPDVLNSIAFYKQHNFPLPDEIAEDGIRKCHPL
jgi:hypothetical protein